MKTRLLAALCFELPAPAGGELAPKTFTLIPAPGADGLVRGVDGRAWRLSNPAAVVAAFERPYAITENHAGKLAAKQGFSAPAFGWIEKVRTEGGAIVGDVAWTPRGEAALNGREYRYFSPEFVWDEATSEIKRLVGGSVLNDPNLTQLALNAEQTEEPTMSLLAICAALSLANTATEADCVTAINALKAEKQTALNAATTPDPQKFAPREELRVALNRAESAEAEVATLKGAQAEAEIGQLLDQAQDAGKVIPATREHYLAMCRAEGGVDRFRQLLAAMPVIVAPGARQATKKPDAGASANHGLTAEQLAICHNTGLDPQKFAESLAAAGTLQ